MSTIERRVQEQFGRVAADYTRSLVHSDPVALQRVVRLARPCPEAVALDIATGAGHVAMTLAPHVASVIACDITENMLEETLQNAASRGLLNIIGKKGAAEHLPFSDGTFDIVTVRQAPHHFADVRAAVREMARVARPGARIVIVDSYAPDSPLLDRQWNDMEKLRDPSHVRNYRANEWRSMVIAAGLHITFEELDFCTEGGRPMNFSDWTQRMRTPPAAVAELRRRFVEGSTELREFLRVEVVGEDIGFCVPQITIAAQRQAERRA